MGLDEYTAPNGSLGERNHSQSDRPRRHRHGRQPAEHLHLRGSTILPITLGLEAAIITAVITGTEMTALITAAHYSAEIGFSPDRLMPPPRSIAAARMA